MKIKKDPAAASRGSEQECQAAKLGVSAPGRMLAGSENCTSVCGLLPRSEGNVSWISICGCETQKSTVSS